MVYSQALILVPTLCLSRFANARYRVSCSKSLAESGSRVRLMAKGLRKSDCLIKTWSNSAADILFTFYNHKLKQKFKHNKTMNGKFLSADLRVGEKKRAAHRGRWK